MVQVIKDCPLCGSALEVCDDFSERCVNCNYTIPAPILTTTATDKPLCPYCGGVVTAIATSDPLNRKTDIRHVCTSCARTIDFKDELEVVQLSDEVIEKSKELFESSLYTPSDNVWGVGTIKAPDPLDPFTVTIKDCKKIKLHHKEIDIDFELGSDILENIDVIIINGYKFVKEKENA